MKIWTPKLSAAGDLQMMIVINTGRGLRVSESIDASYYDAMDPIVSIPTRRLLHRTKQGSTRRLRRRARARRSSAAEDHKYELDYDKRLIRYYNTNKILRDPKKSYDRQKKRYKKGMLSKHELRQSPEYEGFVFKKWMRPQGF